MSVGSNYLRVARIEQEEAELRAKGYTVERPASGSYDLLATRSGHRIAVVARVQPMPPDQVDEVVELRQRARSDSVDVVRWIMVSPQVEIEVRVDGLEDEIARRIVANPPPLTAHWVAATYGKVWYLQYNSIEIGPAGTRVVGTGIVDVEMLPKNCEPGLEAEFGLHLDFDLVLDAAGRIAEVHRLDVDTSAADPLLSIGGPTPETSRTPA